MTKRQICDSDFWSNDLFWLGNAPTLTSCFQQTVMVGIPCGFLWIISAAYLFWGRRRRREKTPSTTVYPWTLLSILKVTTSTILIFLTCCDLGRVLQIDNSFMEVKLPLMAFISVGIKILTYVLALVWQIFQRHGRNLSSSELFLFWLLLAICEVWTTPIFRVFEAYDDVEVDQLQFITGSLSFPLILCQLVLSAFTDPSYSYLWKDKKDVDYVPNQPLLSRLTFSYLDRLMWFGFRNKITVDDLIYFGSDKTSRNYGDHLLKKWTKEENKLNRGISSDDNSESATRRTTKKSRKPSLFLALAKAIWPLMALSALLEVIITFMVLVPPVILDLLISFTGSKELQWHGYVYASVLFLSSAATTFLTVNNLHVLIFTSLVPRLGLSALVFRKSLRLSRAARLEFTVGEMCNFLSVDTQKIFETMWFANNIWICPLRFILTTALVWQYLGVACLSGLAVMILLTPITIYLARKTQILQGGHMKFKDSRLRQLNEILNGVRVLKLFAWEIPFMEKIKGIRREEVLLLKRLALYKAAIVFVWIFAPFLIAVSSFATFVLISEDNVLTPSIAFVSLTLFNSLRTTLSYLPDTISRLVQCHISIQRLQKFLLCEEIEPQRIGNKPPKGKSIVINKGMFAWSSEESPFLKDIQVSVAEGSLVAVVGRVGSGKSALLSAILGELHVVEGSIDVKGSIAYVAQQAWIQNATLRNNILFMKDMDRPEYNKVLELCCLKPDLKILPAGDFTEIGEKGVNLSGGQKQRVSLARSIYQNSDVYILDDPLSAVDAHVGAHIFSHVIGPNGKLKHKTRILVTHDLSILPEVDHILVMSDGRIVESGKYQDLMKNKGDFSAFVEEHLRTAEENDLESEEKGDGNEDDIAKSEHLSTEDIKKKMIRVGSRLSRSHSSKDPTASLKIKERAQYIDEETMQMGRVKSDVFLTYFRNVSWRLTSLMLISYIAYQSFEIGSSFWLSKWSNDPALPDGSQNIRLRTTRISIYGLLGFGQGLCILFATLILAIGSMRASVLFHSSMLMSVLRAPMLFFDTTPMGRILNRFGKDINVVDVDVPDILNSMVVAILTVLGTMIVIAISSPIFVAIMVPLCLVYFTIQIFYMQTARQLRRLLSITLSPILSCFSESVQGTDTIRAFGAQEYFTKRQFGFMDNDSRCFLNSSGSNRWLGIRLELIGSVVVLIASLLAVIQRNNLDPGTVGLMLSYALSVSVSLNILVKHFTTLENRMVSVERINEYSELTSEESWKKEEDDRISAEWPTEGKVTFRKYSMSYKKNTDLVLKNVNLEIKPQEKIGLVGRTGAGKSSLALALFRTVEAADGSINIDEYDIASLGLHTLRSRLTIIPQDPILFSGPLRINLDPLQQHSDADLWNALEHARLKAFVSSLNSGLDYHVTEGGDNLSVGQRQQLCLARALLKRTRVLILDEATAAMDMETDKLIQSTIRSEFQYSTVITIAHRLHTILDYDRIIVMDKGEIVEQGNQISCYKIKIRISID